MTARDETSSIIVDTSALVTDFNGKGFGFTAITRLASKGLLKLIVPYFVKREFVSRRQIEILEKLKRIKNETDSLLRKGFDTKFLISITNLQTSLDECMTLVNESAEYPFEEWRGRANARVLDLSFDSLNKVINSYFNGLPPFPKEKSRNDIPDAIIFQEIVEYVITNANSIVICGDKNLKAHIISQLGIRCYDSFDDTLGSSFIKQLLNNETRSEIESHNISIVRDSIITLPTLLEEFTSQTIVNELYRLYEDDIDQLDLIPNSVKFEEIQYPLHNLRNANIKYYNQNGFIFDCNGIAVFEVNDYINMYEYDDLEDEIKDSVEITGTVGDYYIVGKKNVSIEFSTKISIRFPDSFATEKIKASDMPLLLMRADMEIEEIEIEETYGLYD